MKVLITLLTIPFLLFANELKIDAIAKLLHDALETDAATNDEVEQKISEYINKLEGGLTGDTLKVGLVLIDAYQVAVNYYNREKGEFDRLNLTYDSIAKDYKNKQTVLFDLLLSTHDSLNTDLLRKYLKNQKVASAENKKKISGYLLNKNSATLADTLLYLNTNCTEKKNATQICDNVSKMAISKNNYLDLYFLTNTCIKCLDIELSDGEAKKVYEKMKEALQLQKLYNKDYFDENELIFCDQKISELETRIKLKKEKEAKEKKEKEQTK
jgi:hypothetical protein